MKKYGIEIEETDNTIGCRGRLTWEEWYSTESERDEKYNSYTQKNTSSLKDTMIEQDIADSAYVDGDEYTTTTYSKIEK